MKHASMLFLLFISAQPASGGALDALSGDGWYTWRAAAADGVSGWCCIDASRHETSRGCNLDSRRHGYTECGGSSSGSSDVSLYAKIESGSVAELRLLSPDCPVRLEEPLTDLGTLDARESFEWLRRLVTEKSEVSEDALAGIAMHRGDEPLRFLVDSAYGGLDGESREQAIFWLGELRAAEGAPVIERLMLGDESPDVRGHAAFVLAHSGVDGSEEAIMKAVIEDPDREVREEAVFALSQLPGERGVDSLLRIVEDRRLEHEAREEALFWLVQSESDRAFASIERLLGGNATP